MASWNTVFYHNVMTNAMKIENPLENSLILTLSMHGEVWTEFFVILEKGKQAIVDLLVFSNYLNKMNFLSFPNGKVKRIKKSWKKESLELHNDDLKA